MDNGVDFVFGENFSHRVSVLNTRLIKLGTFAGDGLNFVNDICFRVTQIVNDNRLIARFDKFNTCVAADITGASRNKNCHNRPPKTIIYDKLNVICVFCAYSSA